MIKVIPLTESILKGFVRNWRSIVLLIVFPLILIGIVFVSFNPDGIRKIPVGFIGSFDEFNINDFKDSYFSYLSVTEYGTLSDCLSDLKKYRLYVCLEVRHENAYILQAYYDNTKEPVIWEIIERIKSTIDLLQKQRSKQIASEFLQKFSTTLNKVDEFNKGLTEADTQIAAYLINIGTSTQTLSNAKSDLSSTLISMDNDISDIRTTKQNAQREKNEFYTEAYDMTQDMIGYLNSLTNVSGSNFQYINSAYTAIYSIRNKLNNYNSQANGYLNDIDMRVSRYESASSKGKGYVGEINNGIYTLDGTKKNLITYSNKISTSRTELATIKNDFGNLKNLDAEVLVNPIVIRNTPTYVPQVPEGFVEEFKGGTESEQAKQIVKGVNLISLQTVFPTILLLITFFLSLLISTFICLSEINSPAYKRINLIKGIFFPALLSVYISSIIIVMLPLFCILLLGNFLFNLAIFPNIFCVGIVLFFLSSIFIVTGMALAYLIKRESTTMLVTAFILVFLIFFSGFLLPTERMREISGVFADNFPGKIALSAFNKVVFYNHGVPIIAHELNVLLAWLIGVIAAAILVKKLRKA